MFGKLLQLAEMNRTVKQFFTLLCIAVLASCAGQTSRTAKFEKTNFDNLPSWNEDKHSAAMAAFKTSCEKILAQEAEGNISRATSVGGSVIDWQVPCMEASFHDKFSDKEAKAFFERWFQPYRVSDGSSNFEGTLTGYFEIELTGSKKRTAKYKYPIYKRPTDLDSVKGSSYITHEAINNGALDGKNLELAWVDNRARLYFMHIQGSGIVKMQDGDLMRVGFDGSNGYSFQGISGAVRDYDLKFRSQADMIDWLHKNPDDCIKIVQSDPSYVFFRKVQCESALGGHGVPLKKERSLAVDVGLYPYGTPIWVEANLPLTDSYRKGKYNRLFIAQDAGGAIKGAVRGDVFFGYGKKAEQVAHSFKTKGKFYALFPKTVNIPAEYTTN